MLYTYARLALLQASEAANAQGVISGNVPNNTYPLDYCLLWFEGAWWEVVLLSAASAWALSSSWT